MSYQTKDVHRKLYWLDIICLDFLDDTWWLILFRVFGPSILLYTQCFSGCSFQPFSGVSCQTQTLEKG